LSRCTGDDRVADAASGEFQGGVGVLDLDAWPEGDAGALGALGELSARRVLVAPAGFGQHEDGHGKPFDGHHAVQAVGVGAGVDNLELCNRRADVEPLVVDRQRDQSSFEASRRRVSSRAVAVSVGPACRRTWPMRWSRPSEAIRVAAARSAWTAWTRRASASARSGSIGSAMCV
jgi:hypothetical protein